MKYIKLLLVLDRVHKTTFLEHKHCNLFKKSLSRICYSLPILALKMVHFQKVFSTGLVGLAVLVQAHPGHDVTVEAAERAAVLKTRRGIAHCAEILKARGFEAKNIARRQLAVEQLRLKRAAKRGKSRSIFT